MPRKFRDKSTAIFPTVQYFCGKDDGFHLKNNRTGYSQPASDLPDSTYISDSTDAALEKQEMTPQICEKEY
ncbi:MAG: hypothetical protein LBD45_03215 [Bacteroidales bacterium]|jgi:hypothetical protein|nr:hypothetical protein [Bacteroidales bacterium]